MRKPVFLTAVLLLLLGSCGEKVEMDPEMYASNEISLMVKGKKVFNVAEGDRQLAFNRDLNQFRAGNDDMSSYFVLTCQELPCQEGQEVTADLRWTTGGNMVKSQKNILFRVEKYESTGLVWLWCATDKTGAVVRILD